MGFLSFLTHGKRIPEGGRGGIHTRIGHQTVKEP